ncbi:3-isopropylmalate dehydratase small subunit [Paraburkholderia sp.]|uniref:3-isopropylmalate dehydratase small subunit n=1 Tax=Paraburkholderia sp. TaxID=1926495 RepID=UPI00286F37CA|nr:3-isopropylmalate dehydratase small subunit [Paraburkholderia sp.]
MAKAHDITGVAAPLPINNLDTDQIMPKQFLLGIDKTGLARGLLYDLRFDAEGRARDRFVLNQDAYRHAKILIGGANFGCGSSREHAVWGLQQAGFEAVIAPSYGEIFYFNAANNRLLLVVLPPDQIEALVREIEHGENKPLTIDVDGQVVHSPSGQRYAFALPARQKQMLVEGLDMIGMTLRDADAIDAFEQRHWAANPWSRIDLPAQRARMAQREAQKR